jgi:hypothetical protein
MDRYEKSDIYQIKCMDFPLKYEGKWAKYFTLDIKTYTGF